MKSMTRSVLQSCMVGWHPPSRMSQPESRTEDVCAVHSGTLGSATKTKCTFESPATLGSADYSRVDVHRSNQRPSGVPLILPRDCCALADYSHELLLRGLANYPHESPHAGGQTILKSPHSGRQTILILKCWVCGTSPTTLQRARSLAHQIGELI